MDNIEIDIYIMWFTMFLEHRFAGFLDIWILAMVNLAEQSKFSYLFPELDLLKFKCYMLYIHNKYWIYWN